MAYAKATDLLAQFVFLLFADRNVWLPRAHYIPMSGSDRFSSFMRDDSSASPLYNCGILGGRVSILRPFMDTFAARLESHWRVQAESGRVTPSSQIVDMLALNDAFLSPGSPRLVSGYPLGELHLPFWGRLCSDRLSHAPCHRNFSKTCQRLALLTMRDTHFFSHKVDGLPPPKLLAANAGDVTPRRVASMSAVDRQLKASATAAERLAAATLRGFALGGGLVAGDPLLLRTGEWAWVLQVHRHEPHFRIDYRNGKTSDERIRFDEVNWGHVLPCSPGRSRTRPRRTIISSSYVEKSALVRSNVNVEY